MKVKGLTNDEYYELRHQNEVLMEHICFSSINNKTKRIINGNLINGFSFYDGDKTITMTKESKVYNDEISIDGCYVANDWGSNTLRLFKDDDNKMSNKNTMKMIEQFSSSIKRCRNWGTSIQDNTLIDLSKDDTISNDMIYEYLFMAKSIEEFVMWANNELRICDFRGKECRTYRISGNNTYFWDYDLMKKITPMNKYFLDDDNEYRDAIISSSISRKLKWCSCCNRYIYFARSYITSKESKRAFIKLDSKITYCFECVKQLPKCKECNKVKYEDAKFSKNGNCKSCEYEFKKPIHSYGYKPKFKYFDLDSHGQLKSQFVPFYKNNRKKFKLEKTFIGLELEMEKNPNHDIDDNYEFANKMSKMMKDKYKKYSFYNTYDGSLNSSGFELHNHPMTFDSWKNVNWEFIYDGYNYQSWNDNCGLHIHINRMSFTPFQMYKMIDFMYANLNLVCHIANRKDNSKYNQWARFNKYFIQDFKNVLCGSMSHRYDKKYFSNSMGQKYNAINCVSSKTFEFRFFGGAKSGIDLREKIEFLMSIKRFVKFNYHMRQIPNGSMDVSEIQNNNKDLNKLNTLNYIQFVNDNQNEYPSLNKKFNDDKTTKSIIDDANSIPSFIQL